MPRYESHITDVGAEKCGRVERGFCNVEVEKLNVDLAVVARRESDARAARDDRTPI
jgi:hypothetical protein